MPDTPRNYGVRNVHLFTWLRIGTNWCSPDLATRFTEAEAASMVARLNARPPLDKRSVASPYYATPFPTEKGA